MHMLIWLTEIFKTEALSQLNGDLSGSGSADDQKSNQTEASNSTLGGEDDVPQDSGKQNQTEGNMAFYCHSNLQDEVNNVAGYN